METFTPEQAAANIAKFGSIPTVQPQVFSPAEAAANIAKFGPPVAAPPPQVFSHEQLMQNHALGMERVASTINLNDRWGTLQVLRSVPNEHLQDLVAAAQRVAAKAPPAGYVKRLGKGLATGAAGFAQGIAELAGLGGTEDEIAVIQQLEAATRQELYPKDASTLANIPVQATEMAFPAVAMAGGGALAGGAARAAIGAGALGGGAAGAAAAGMGAGAIETAATIGGVTAATFPGEYRQSKATLRADGVDSFIAKPVAVGTALLSSAFESVIPNPFKGNPVIGQGVSKAVSSYLASVLKRYPGELSEEFFQSAVHSAGETVATWMDANAPDVPFDGKAFQKSLSDTVQAAGPLALVMGVPAAAHLPSVVRAEQNFQQPPPPPPGGGGPPAATPPQQQAPAITDDSVPPEAAITGDSPALNPKQEKARRIRGSLSKEGIDVSELATSDKDPIHAKAFLTKDGWLYVHQVQRNPKAPRGQLKAYFDRVRAKYPEAKGVIADGSDSFIASVMRAYPGQVTVTDTQKYWGSNQSTVMVEFDSPDVMGPTEAPPSRAMQITKAIEKMGQVMDPVTGRPTGEVRVRPEMLSSQFYAAKAAPIAARPIWYDDVKRMVDADSTRSWRSIWRELVTGGRFADAESDRVAEETAKQQEVGEAFAALRFENAEAEAAQLASEKWLPVDPESPPPAEYVEIRPGQFGRNYYRFLTKRGGTKDAGRQRVPDERKPGPTRYVGGVPGPEAETGADRPGQVGPAADDVRGVPDGGQTEGGLAAGVEPTGIMSVNPPEQVESTLSDRQERIIRRAEAYADSTIVSQRQRNMLARLAAGGRQMDEAAWIELEKRFGKDIDKQMAVEAETAQEEAAQAEIAKLPEWIRTLTDEEAVETHGRLVGPGDVTPTSAKLALGKYFGGLTPTPADTKRTPPVPAAAPQVAPEPESGQEAAIPTTAQEAAEAWAAKERVGVDAGFDLNAIENQKQRILQIAKGVTDEWKSLDEVTPKKIGRQAELRANVPKHLKDLRELGYAQMAWDRQGNTYHAKAGVPLPAWLTQSENDADLESLPDRKSVVEAAPIVSDGEVADTAAVPSGKTAPPANAAQAQEASPEAAVLPTGNMTRESLESMEPGEVERIWRERTPGAPKFTQKSKSELIAEILGEEPPAPAPKKLGLRPFGAESTPPDRMVKRIGKSAENSEARGATSEREETAVPKEPWQLTRDEFVGEFNPPYSVNEIQLASKKATGARKRFGKRTGAWVPPSISSEISGKISAQEGTAESMREEYRAYSDAYHQRARDHYEAAAQAVKAGKPVPDAVLADYPDLKPVAKTASTSPEVPTEVAKTEEAEPEKPPADIMSVNPDEQGVSDLLGKLRFKQRSTPAIGSPERTALDAELADAKKAQEASSAKMAKLKADYDKTKAYSKKRETLKKQIDKTRSADGEVWQRWVNAKNKHRLAVMEDRAASDEPLVALPAAYQVGLARLSAVNAESDAQKFRDPVSKAVETELRKHTAKAAFLADGEGKLPADIEAQVIDRAVAEATAAIVNNPMRVDTVDGAIDSLRGYIRGARIQEYAKITQAEIDKAVPPDSENRGALKWTRDMSTFDQMDKEVEKAKGIAKSNRQAEKMLKEAKKGEAVANAKSLKPLVTKGSSVDQGWAGDVSAEQSRLMSDGRVIIDTESGAIAKNDIATMRRNEQPHKSRVALFSQVWDSLSDKGDLDLLGVLERGEFDVAVFADKFDDPHFFSKDIVAYMSRVGKADSYSLMSGSGVDLLGFKRDGKLYAVAMGVAQKKRKIPMDVKAARGADPMRAAGSYSLGDLDDASPELLKLKQRPTRKGLRKGLSKAVIAELTHGRITPDTVSGMRGWHVEVGDTYFTVLDAAPENFRSVLEADIGHPMSNEEWATVNAAGAFLMELPDGTRHSGLGFILLSESALEGTLAHELLHLGKAAGLIGKQEWQSMADKYAPDEQDSLKQEEMIAAAVDMTQERDPQLYGILERVRAWVRRWLAKLGVGPMQANDVFMMLRSAGYWAKAKTPTDIMSVKYSRRGEGNSPRLFGRPDLAKMGTSDEVRSFEDNVDEARNQAGRPAVKHRDDVDKAGDELLAADRQGILEEVIAAGRSGQSLGSVEKTDAAIKLFRERATPALRSNDPEAIADLINLKDAIRETRAETARILGYAIDPLESPAERMQRAINESLLELPLKEQRRREQFLEKYREAMKKAGESGRTKDQPGDGDSEYWQREADKWLLEAQRINLEWAKKAAELKAKLRILGVDLDNLNEAGYSKQKAADVLAVIHHAKARPSDKAYEYWRNAILSAPTTQVANALGNTLHSVWSLTAERAVEVLANTVVKDPMGAQVGEYKYLLNGVLPGVARGARNFMATWRSESPTLEYEIGQVGQWRIEDPNTAIGDWSSDIPVLKQLAWLTSGKRIRWPQRLLGAVDDFAKSVFTEMEAGAQAYRIAKSEGKTGDDLAKRTAELTADYQSQAWKIAYGIGRELMFQQQGGKLVQAVTRQTLQARRDIMGLRYLLPFVTTPINIFATGVKKSPLGSLDIGKKMYENWKKGDSPSKGLTPQMAQQVIAWAMVLALMDWTDPDDPKITGSAGELDPASREVGFRTRPPQSIKLGDQWYSYSRLEPFATAIGMTIDWIDAFRSGDWDKMANTPLESLVGQAKNKTFLAGVADVLKALEADKPTDSAVQWASNFATSWVPNVVRSASREAADTYPQRKVWGKGGEWWSRLGRRTLQKTEVSGLTEYPIYDVWGRPANRSESPVGSDWLYRITVPVKTQEAEMFAADRLILNYNNANEEDATFPRIPQPYYRKDGETVYMTDGQFADFVRLSGEAAVAGLSGRAVTLDAANPTDAAVRWINEVTTEARGLVRERLIEQWAGEGGELSTTEIGQEAADAALGSLAWSVASSVAFDEDAADAADVLATLNPDRAETLLALRRKMAASGKKADAIRAWTRRLLMRWNNSPKNDMESEKS